jgi:hypothetical protein
MITVLELMNALAQTLSPEHPDLPVLFMDGKTVKPVGDKVERVHISVVRPVEADVDGHVVMLHPYVPLFLEGAERHPRGRDASNALSEVRTVLGRAERALARLQHPTEYPIIRVDGEEVIDWDNKAEDPDAEAMRACLTQVIDLLDPWRRTGRTVKPLPN